MNLNELSVQQLKALGYDYFLQREPLINCLQSLNSNTNSLNQIKTEIDQREAENNAAIANAIK